MAYRNCIRLLAPLLLLGSAGTALAGEGRLELNHDCALAGCFAGDSAGYPITITTSGSYVLASDLVVTAGVVGINIRADQAKVVDIDLNGFALRGGGSCTGTPVTSCSGALGIRGLDVTQPAANDHVLLTVRNGSVVGFQSIGILLAANTAGGAPLASGSKIEGVTVSENGNDGIVFELENGIALSLVDVQVVRNGARGAGAANGVDGNLEVRNFLAHGNGSVGLSPASGAFLLQSRFLRNGGNGVICSPNCTLAMGDNLFGGNAGSQYAITTIRDLGGNVCLEASCP